ncbi:MAG: hypothetical protein Q7U91_05750 [Sideroxyarcus sp.]|nr:hypothetical protein [Sideroxyarcus sp.]
MWLLLTKLTQHGLIHTYTKTNQYIAARSIVNADIPYMHCLALSKDHTRLHTSNCLFFAIHRWWRIYYYLIKLHFRNLHLVPFVLQEPFVTPALRHAQDRLTFGQAGVQLKKITGFRPAPE